MTNKSATSKAVAAVLIGCFSVVGLFAQAAPTVSQESTDKPRVFMDAGTHDNGWHSRRDQSMEMGKDLGRDCPGVRLTINQQNADYTVLLNDIKVGFGSDYFQIANRSGDIIVSNEKAPSIRKGMKKACSLILNDWSSHHVK